MPSKPMRIAVIGAGRAAAHLGLALHALRQRPVALGARDASRAQALGDALRLPVLPPELAVAQADWVFLAVPDGAIEPLARALPWRAGQVAVHLSGATPLDALQAAARLDAAVAGFHPLQLLATPLPTPAQALAAFEGITVAVEAEGTEVAVLSDLARRLGARPMSLDSTQRARYHLAANAAASGLLAPLALAMGQLRTALGLEEAQAWVAIAPMVQGTLRAVSERGLAGAVSGPVARGDVAVVQAHLAALAGQRDEAVLYRALLRGLLPLAEAGGRLSPQARAALVKLL
jgi:predicted short-subunit dehydrogenase-like oxidoreductase (DUF2520 family)